MKTIIVIMIAGLLLATAGGTYAWKLYHKYQAEAATTWVRVEPAARGDLVEIVSAPGQVQPKTKVSISARVSAQIMALPFEEGDKVTAGNAAANPPVPASVLVRLDDKDLQALRRAAEARCAAQREEIEVARSRLAAQEAQITATRAILAEAELDLKRQTGLLVSSDVSQAIVDASEAKAKRLRAELDAAIQNQKADLAQLTVMQHNLKAAEADIERAQDALKYTTITSPIDGVVTRLNTKVGELAVTGTMNNPGTVIMEVADLSQMLLVARVDETSIAGLAVGQPAKVRLQAYPDEIFSGTVETVALAHTEERDGSRYYKTEVRLKIGDRRIYSGLNGDADIETRRHQGVLKVASQAVLARPVDELPVEIRDRPEVDKSRSTATVVYRHIDGKAIVTPVTIGPSDVTHTIIRSGLSAGDRVIAGPYKVLETLKHDQLVKDERDKPTTRPAAR